jgi:hypothetical protein
MVETPFRFHKLLGMAGMVAIPVLQSCKEKSPQPNRNGDEITLGFIGLGQQSMFLLVAFSR